MLELKKLWYELGQVPVNEHEEIDEDFYIFNKGTSIYTIWQYFDEQCKNGLVKDLMFKGGF